MVGAWMRMQIVAGKGHCDVGGKFGAKEFWGVEVVVIVVIVVVGPAAGKGGKSEVRLRGTPFWRIQAADGTKRGPAAGN